MGAVTTARLKEALTGYKGTADDTQLAAELGIAEAQVAALCGWPVADDGTQSFLSATYTLYPQRSEARKRLLVLPFEPSSVTSVHETQDDTYDATTLVDSDDYTITREGIWRTNGGTWTATERGVQVVCVAGWASDSAPASVEAAVLAQAIHRWRVLRRGQGMAQATQQGTSVSRDALVAVPDLVRAMAQASPAWRWTVAIG